MPESVTITMPGKPRGKQRPFMTRKGFAFTPKQTRVQEATVKTLAIDAMEGAAPLEGPVEIDLIAFMEIPASWSRKKRLAAQRGEIAPTGKPDLDNVLKLFADSMNGIVYRDDSQVVEARVSKRYAATPYTIATVKLALLHHAAEAA